MIPALKNFPCNPFKVGAPFNLYTNFLMSVWAVGGDHTRNTCYNIIETYTRDILKTSCYSDTTP